MKDIPGYEGLYAVAEDGRVWSYPRTWHGGRRKNWRSSHPGKWLKPRIGKSEQSYFSVNLCINGKARSFNIHKLVAQAFVPNPLNLPQVNHKDANRRNNHYTNLEWVTSNGNHMHAKDRGLFRPRHGENHYFHKLTSEQVDEVRRKRKLGMKHREIAEQYGVSTTTITNIINMRARANG